MLYLILAILFSSMISILMRLSESRCDHKLGMLTVNYIVSAVLSAVMTRGTLLPRGDGAGTTIGLGILSGVLYLASFLLLQINISKNGVVMGALFMKLGITVPTIASILFFGEKMTLLRGLGLALALTGIFVFNFEKSEDRIAKPWLLIILLLVAGFTDMQSKIYEFYGNPAFSNQYLLFTFCIALILCAALTAMKHQRIGSKEALWGIVIGLPNYLSSLFLLLSLSSVDAVVAYPVYCVASIVIVSVVGTVAFREKLTLSRLSGIAIVAAAVALLNIG